MRATPGACGSDQAVIPLVAEHRVLEDFWQPTLVARGGSGKRDARRRLEAGLGTCADMWFRLAL